jgi:hypothetical protein
MVMQVIAEAKREEQENAMSVQKIRSENDRFTRYGERRAKKTGIEPRRGPGDRGSPETVGGGGGRSEP